MILVLARNLETLPLHLVTRELRPPFHSALPSGLAFSLSFQDRLVSQGWVASSQRKVPAGVDGETPDTGVEWEGLLPPPP